jgi:hypothetical protein
MKIEVKSNVPVRSGAGRPAKYPFASMGVGKSFTVKASNYSALTCAIKWSERNQPTWKFKGSMSEGKLTIWRIK